MNSSQNKTQEASTPVKQVQQTPSRRCLYCGHYAELVWVHGHGQCSACGINTQECCQGENCAFS